MPLVSPVQKRLPGWNSVYLSYSLRASGDDPSQLAGVKKLLQQFGVFRMNYPSARAAKCVVEVGKLVVSVKNGNFSSHSVSN